MNTAQWSIQRERALEFVIVNEFALKVDGLIGPQADLIDDASDYKIYAKDGSFLLALEIKNDRKSAKTGRLFFETFNPVQNKPSGLGACKADKVAHLCHPRPEHGEPHRLLLYSPKDMLAYIDAQYEEQPGGCGKRSKNPVWFWHENAGDGTSNGSATFVEVVTRLPFVEQMPVEWKTLAFHIG